MLFIAKEMITGFKHLFSRGRFRFVLIFLSLLAATISVSELLVMKFFATLVLHEGEYSSNTFLFAAIGFFIFFLVTRISQFYQRNYRVKAFARSFRATNKGIKKKRKVENLEWAMAFELTNVLSLGAQLAAITLFFLILNPVIALLNAILISMILHVVGVLFRNQIQIQAELAAKKGKERAKPDKRYGVRIRAAETGTLASGAGMLILLAMLLIYHLNDHISAANTLVFFLGARLQNSVISNASRSLMRYAKSNSRTAVDDDSE
ncbi:MAG: hypothetical protein RL733_155 [Actinomycetota bacterium]|jgi:hypothetical protein